MICFFFFTSTFVFIYIYRGSTSFFSIWHPAAQHYLLKRLFFLMELSGTLVKNWCIVVYFCTLTSIPLICMSLLTTVPHFTVAFIVSYEIRNVSPPTLLYFKTILRYSGSSAFPYEFKDQLVHVCKKPTWDFGWLGLHWVYIGQFGECWILNNIQSSDPWTWDIFMFT